VPTSISLTPSSGEMRSALNGPGKPQHVACMKVTLAHGIAQRSFAVDILGVGVSSGGEQHLDNLLVTKDG
jgi:hypothetical protein